jgi:large subunit ribosomal protein L1
MRFRSKRYKQCTASQIVEKVDLNTAVEKIQQWGNTKFNQSVECVVNLGIDSKQADQAVRGAISLPHGIGKTLRVIAFCEGDDATKAKEAGAIEVGGDELVDKVQKGWFDFDVAVAHPKLMGKVGKLGRVLGPQGKMPSPKSGTVTPQVAQAVKEYAAGKVEFRNDTGGNVHAVVGKVNFEPAKLIDNINAFMEMIRRLKPTGAKGVYIKKVCLSATMSPSVLVDIQ